MANESLLDLALQGATAWNKQIKAMQFDYVDFSGTDFTQPKLKDINFDNFNFGDSTNFSNCIFGDGCSFRSATFRNYVNFSGSHFEKTVFAYSHLGTHANFAGCLFGWVNFSEIVSHGIIDFTGSIFLDAAIFENSSFLGECRFDLCEFSYVDFSVETEKQGKVGFRYPTFCQTLFKQMARFNNRQFTDTTDFSNAVFKIAPQFHNCELHQDTSFEQTTFEDMSSRWAERNYRTLKLAMNKHHAYSEEMMFFGYEMRSRRNKEKWYSSWLYWIYEAFSNYGQSIIRPIVSLFCVYWIFLIVHWNSIFGYHLEKVSGSDGLARLGQLYSFTLIHTLPFLIPVLKDSSRLPLELDQQPTIWITIAVATHTTVSISLFFLLILGLRNRFRLKG